MVFESSHSKPWYRRHDGYDDESSHAILPKKTVTTTMRQGRSSQKGMTDHELHRDALKIFDARSNTKTLASFAMKHGGGLTDNNGIETVSDRFHASFNPAAHHPALFQDHLSRRNSISNSCAGQDRQKILVQPPSNCFQHEPENEIVDCSFPKGHLRTIDLNEPEARKPRSSLDSGIISTKANSNKKKVIDSSRISTKANSRRNRAARARRVLDFLEVEFEGEERVSASGNSTRQSSTGEVDSVNGGSLMAHIQKSVSSLQIFGSVCAAPSPNATTSTLGER